MKYLQFFQERIPGLPSPNDKGECVVPCIFHQDKNPSLAVNVQSGKWKCYTPHCPGHAGGGWKKFDALLKGEVTTSGEVKVPPIEQSAIDGFHAILLQSKTALDILINKRGLTLETIKRFQLGWDSDRILIPVRGPDGSIVNVRKYAYGAAKDKMIAWGPRYNRARLYPFENTASDWVLLCEGELDALLACQMGYPAITATGGADTWLAEFNEQLKGKRVVICYDCDPAGRKGASATAQKLAPHAREVLVLTLPLAGSKEEKDVTDYFVTLKHTKADFDKLLESAVLVKPIGNTDNAPPEKVEDIHLSRVGEHRYVGKRVRSTILVAGKDLAPYQVPYKIAYSCPAVGSEKACDRCHLAQHNGQRVVQMREWSTDMLQCVNVPVEKLHQLMGRICGIPERCPKYKYEVQEYANIESIKAIPEIDFAAEESEYVIRNLFYLGHGIETNKTYHMTGVVMPDPKSQYATALVYDATPSQDSIEKFEATDEVRSLLRMFKVD